MLKSIKVRIYPDNVQKEFISKQLGCCRLVYNKCLEYKETQFKLNNESKIFYVQLSKYLTELKKSDEYSFLRDVSCIPLQQTLRDLDSAYKNYFDLNMGIPKFKSKHAHKQSCRFIDTNNKKISKKKINGNRITLPKALNNILFKCSRRDEIYLNHNQKSIHSITLIKASTEKYFLSILIDYNVNKKNKLNTTIGLDLGIKDFIVDSNNNRYENKHFYKTKEKKIKKLSHQLSKKKKSSRNSNKTRIKLAKIHEKIKNQRNTYLHQITSKLVNENQVICIEDLNVNGMLNNHRLSKSIQELSLFEFRRQLEYKCNWYGRQLVIIDRFYPSSKTCHNCEYIYRDLKLSQREWICPHCGKKVDRDYNASLNILDEGLKQLNKNRGESTRIYA